MRKLLPPLLLLASIALLQCGCVNHGAIVVTGLHVELTGIERTSDGTVSVSWRVENPNVTPYLIARISHKIYLNGALVGTTATNDPLGLARQGNVARTSKLSPAGPVADQILTAAAGHGPVPYRVDSQLTIQMYGDEFEKGELSNSGSVAITVK